MTVTLIRCLLSVDGSKIETTMTFVSTATVHGGTELYHKVPVHCVTMVWGPRKKAGGGGVFCHITLDSNVINHDWSDRTYYGVWKCSVFCLFNTFRRFHIGLANSFFPTRGFDFWTLASLNAKWDSKSCFSGLKVFLVCLCFLSLRGSCPLHWLWGLLDFSSMRNWSDQTSSCTDTERSQFRGTLESSQIQSAECPESAG